jgi:hypothetical protein
MKRKNGSKEKKKENTRNFEVLLCWILCSVVQSTPNFLN